MWNYVDQTLDPSEISLPLDRSIFFVRRWVGKTGDGLISFVARSPEDYMKSLSLDIEFEPDVSVVVGYFHEGEFYDENGYIDDTFEADAILAWTTIPDAFSNEGSSARKTMDFLLTRVSGS